MISDSPRILRHVHARHHRAWTAAGLGIYLLHTTVLEMIFARSLGKLLVGTRVAALDGSRPSPGAILVRNILRLVDIILVFIPLLFVFSTLRQRLGDMAAGTIVVINTPSEVTPPSTPPEPPVT